MFNSYLQLELRRQNIWHAGHHRPMANFKSVAYVHKRCRSKYKTLSMRAIQLNNNMYLIREETLSDLTDIVNSNLKGCLNFESKETTPRNIQAMVIEIKSNLITPVQGFVSIALYHCCIS